MRVYKKEKKSFTPIVIEFESKEEVEMMKLICSLTGSIPEKLAKYSDIEEIERSKYTEFINEMEDKLLEESE